MSVASYSTRRLDHLGLVAGMCEHLGLVEEIDRLLPGSGRQVSHGQALKAMVVNALGFSSRPLYLSPEFWANKPVELLVGEGVTAEMLNDDSLGRTLDACFEYGITALFSQVAQRALKLFSLCPRAAHLDTTSFSFFGDYGQPDTSETAVEITYGYSKDHRPDLKQLVFAVITAQQSTIPLWIEAIDGNHTDAKSMPSVIQGFCEQLDGADCPLLVMDAAFYSADNIAAHPHGGWLSRVPDTLKEVQQLYASAHKNTWVSTSEENFRYQESRSSYGGVEQRWLLVHSKDRQHRQEETFKRQLSSKQEDAEQAWSSLGRRSFACRADAQVAATRLSKSWPYHRVEPEFAVKYHYRKSGRPAAGAVPERESWRVSGKVVEDVDAIAAHRQKLGMYVLASNELDASSWSSSSLLELYRSQSKSVERGFRFLKDPLFFAHAVYLKKPERIMALLMVMTLSLLVYSLAEKALRDGLRDNNQTLPDQKGKPSTAITIRRVFQIFEGIDILSIDLPGQAIRQILNFNDLHAKIVALFPPPIKNIYALQGGCGR